MLNKLPSSLFPWKHNKTKTPMTTLAVEHQTMEDEEAGNLEQELLPCVICGRTFLPTPLAKHTRVCERNATRKRKVFDSLKQRVEGTDLAPFHQKSYLKKIDPSPLPKSEARQSKWKEKHIELVNAIRAAKGTSSSMPSTLGKRSSTALGTPTHERCPSCDRQFGPKAFDRHVEWCKEKKTTIHKSPASVLLAKERLEARTKYKVPPLIKSRRALTREKYSPQTNSRSEAVVNAKSVSACTLDRSPSVRRSENPLNSRKSVDRMADGGSGQVEQNVEKIIKEKVEKTVADSAVKMVQSEKNLSKEVKKTGEPVKSSVKRLIFSKINTISVNDDIEGLTVSSLSFGENDSKRLVTWKDTVKASKSDYTPLAKSKNLCETRSVVNTTLNSDNSNLPSKHVHLETFSNIAQQSKIKKWDSNFKLVVKDKKPDDASLKRQNSNASTSKKVKSPTRKSKLDQPFSSSKTAVRKPVLPLRIDNKQQKVVGKTGYRGVIKNPTKRLPAGGKYFKSGPPKANLKMDRVPSLEDLSLDLDTREEYLMQDDDTLSLVTLPTLQTDDIDNKSLLEDIHDTSSNELVVLSDNFEPDGPIPRNLDDIVDKDSDEAILDGDMDDNDILKMEYYQNELSSLKQHLNTLESDFYITWKQDFLEGQEANGGKSPRSKKKASKSRSESLKGSERSPHKKGYKSRTNSPKIQLQRSPTRTELKHNSKALMEQVVARTSRASSPASHKSRNSSSKSPKRIVKKFGSKDQNRRIDDHDMLPNKFRTSNRSPKEIERRQALEIMMDYQTRKGAKKSSAKKSSVNKHSFRSSSEVILNKKPFSKGKMAPSKERETRSASATPRYTDNYKFLGSMKEVKIISSSVNSPNVGRKSRATSPTIRKPEKGGRGAKTGNHSPITKFEKSSNITSDYLEQLPYLNKATKSKPHSKENSPRSLRESSTFKSKYSVDNVVTQYERLKAQVKDRKLEKVDSDDVGISCLTRFRLNTKIMNCERFLERNKLVSMSLKPSPSSSEDTDTFSFPDRLMSDQCCQTSSIEGIVKTTIDQNDLEPKACVGQGKDPKEHAGKSREGLGINETYFDSLDESSNSVDSEIYQGMTKDTIRSKENTTTFEHNVKEGTTSDTQIQKINIPSPTFQDLKEKRSKSNVLYIRATEDSFSEDSVVDGCEDYHSHALSVARIERGLRKCSSDICLHGHSDSNFISYTEIDLRKLASYECTSIRSNRFEDGNLTSDEILEIAGEQFLQSLTNSSQIRTSTPISQRKARCPRTSDYVPFKRRRLEKEITSKDKDGEESDVECKETRRDVSPEDVLRRNIEQIKEKKMELNNFLEDQQFKELVKNSSNYFNILQDDIVSQVEMEPDNKDSIEMKRILSTIEEASSNTSSGVTNRPSNSCGFINNNGDLGNPHVTAKGIAQCKCNENEVNLIDFDADCPPVSNGFQYVANHYEILQPIKIGDMPAAKLYATLPLRRRNKSQSRYTLTDVHTKRRPDSAEVATNLSPRFLHLIRTIIHPQGAITPGKNDAEEEFLKISRAHCRKLLQLDKQKLSHILESEPLKLPRITTVSTVRGVPKSPTMIISLPPIEKPHNTLSARKGISPKSNSSATPRRRRIRPVQGEDYSRTRMSMRAGNKGTLYGSETDLLDKSHALAGVGYNLSPRPKRWNSLSHFRDNQLNKLATNHTNNTATNNTNDYNPFVLAERQLMELLECDDYKTTPAPPPTTVQNTPRPHTSNTTNIAGKKETSKSPIQKKKTVKSANPKLQTQSRAKTNKPTVPKRASVIDPPVDFRDRLSMLTDDFDAIENMINSSYSQDDEKIFYSKADNNSFSLNAILSQKLYSDDISIIDPRLINENDNLSIPESLHIDDSSPTSILDNNYFELGNHYDDIDHFSQNFDTEMSTIESNCTEIKLKQSISMFDDEKFLESGNIDEFVIALSESSVDTKFNVKKSSNKNASKVKKTIKSSKLPKSVEKSNASQNSSYGYSSSAKDRKKNNLASLKRSISLLDPVQKPKPLKNKRDVQNYFNEQELKSPTKVEKGLLCGKIEAPSNTTKLPEDDLFVPKAEELFSVDDEMYEEYKKYEEMYLKEKEEKLKKEERRISDGQSGLLTASEDDDSQQQTFKMSGDSAYGSLNRKAPKVRARSTKLTPLDSQRNLAGDSPNSSSSELSPVIPTTPPSIPKMSKFCHECGNRYPVNSAKFCVECGVKRLVL